jgi:Domain of unknown function (DUF1996)
MRQTILLPASVGIAVLLACAVALLAALASAPAASAASSEHGASFAVRCDFSHRKQVDPIVSPGGTSAHMHDFFGNRSTDASSTYKTMTAAGVSTTCSRPEDTGGYWIPTVSWKDQQGTHELTANRAVFYYRAGGKDYTKVQPFAKDFRIIADKDINGARVRWYCGGGGSNDEKAGSADPPTRCSGGVLGLRIIFPDCVAKGNLNDPNLKPVSSTSNYRADDKITDPDPNTGQVQVIDPTTIDPNTGQVQVIDSFDADPNTPPNNPSHRLHMVRSKAQSDGTRACPSTYIPVPTLTINANFPMPTTSGTVTLSSGDASTIHTDFWNTWNQDAPLNLNPPDGRSYGGLTALVKHCINEISPTSPRPTECRAPTATA